MTKHPARSLCALVAAGLAAPAMADFTYTNQAAFSAVLAPGSYLESYTTTPGSPGLNAPHVFSGGTAPGGGAFTYSASTTAQAFLIFDLGGDRYLTTSGQFGTQWSAPITLTFSGAPVHAIGGAFFMTSAFGSVVGGTVNVSINGGAPISLLNQTDSTFWGYVSTTPITSVTFSPDATHRFMSIDNLYVGASTVPAPGAAAVLLLAGMTAHRRRRAR